MLSKGTLRLIEEELGPGETHVAPGEIAARGVEVQVGFENGFLDCRVAEPDDAVLHELRDASQQDALVGALVEFREFLLAEIELLVNTQEAWPPRKRSR